MDDRRFDALTRTFATAGTRRQMLKGLLGLGGLLGGTIARDASAARRPTPTPKPISCPGNQIPVDGVCTCQSGTKCGPECCPDGAECCDNACCDGTCYGEELCCPTGNIVCEGQCRDWECCAGADCPTGSVCDPTTHSCQCVPNCTGKSCGDDGCGGSCGTCLGGQTCTNGACSCPSGYLCSDSTCHECCADADCPTNQVCDRQSQTCVCAPNCTDKTCGGDGCGGSCGACPDGQTCTASGTCACSTGFLCADGACHQCCAAADCAFTRGGTAECWRCVSGTCGYYSGFCASGVCGISSPDVFGHCLECGVGSDACNAAVPCCSGYYCDFALGDMGYCRLDT